MILEEFDGSSKAIINPEDLNEPITGFPETVLSCFARATFGRILERYPHRQVAETSVANLSIPIYEIDYEGQKLGLFNAYVGAAGCVAILEDLAVFGMKRLVLFGTCGILDHQIEETSIIVPTQALRDEGTSFHYVPASEEIRVNERSFQAFTAFLENEGISYSTGKVWTTDGVYRETPAKMMARKDSGAIAVDMECSAVAAWAQFRQLAVCHFFYAADHLSQEKWQPRTLGNEADLDTKDKIAEIALGFSSFFSA